MSETPAEMTDADVFSALQAAAAQDVAGEQAVEAPEPSPPAPEEGVPVEVTPVVEGQAPVQPEEGDGVVQPEVDQSVPFNPDELPEELLPAWRQMQAAFTPRLQEAAAIRQRFEELGGQETVEQAMNLYSRIANPEEWPALYEELYHAMEEQGFEFEDPASPLAPEPTRPSFSEAAEDPDLAPLIGELQSLRSRTEAQDEFLNRLGEEQDLRQQIAEEELRQTQYLASMSRQVMGIRQSNPHYDDDDIRAIVEIGTFYGDDLATAQQRYESHISRRLDRYFTSKRAGAPQSVQPVAGAGVLSDEDKHPETLQEAEAEAIEFLRRLQAEGELDEF